MKCNRCGEYVETVGDVRASRGCLDGTSQQIPPWMTESTPLADAIEAVPSLANRFVRGSAPLDPTPVIETTKEHLQVEAAAPAAKPKKPKADKPPAKPKPAKKK